MPTVDIFVVRYDGDVRGPDIIEPLLTTVAAATARGRNELDANATPYQTVTIQVDFEPGIRLGQMYLVEDYVTGLNWYGKITGIHHTVAMPVVTTDITLQKPQLPQPQ